MSLPSRRSTTTGTSTRSVPERGTRVTKEKATKGRRAKETKERGKETKEKAKVNELTKPTRGTRRTSLERVPRRVPRARPRRLTCATTVARKGIGRASAATKAAPKPPGSQPTTKGDVGKGAEKGVRTFLEGAYFAMPMVAPSFIESGDKIFWLLDSGSSYHVVSRATLESGHVKVLSRKKKPKTVCQTATGDLVEVGSDTHATIEVNFLTTRPIEKRGGVLSTFACTCRLEAVVSDEIKHNLINLNLLCWKGWRPTLYEGLLTAEQRGITLYPHLYGDCTWLESVVPEHPSAMLASVSSHVGRSVGWSGDFSAHEKQHEFSRHEHEFSHEQHDFPQHGHDFSREQHEQTHVEQIQLPHVGGNTLGGSAVGQSSCDSSGVQLVGQSSCGSSEVQMVGRLPARVVELLQSSTVGKPCQDRRLCQDHVGTPLSSGPTTSSGLGPTLGAQGSLRGSVNESEFLQRSACVHGLVGRSVGRSVGCAEEQLQSPVGRAEESMQLNVAAQLPLKARVGGSGEGAQSRATLGGDGYEGTCKMGATVAACAGDLGARRESSGDRGLGDGKGPSGHDGGYSDGGEVSSEDELEDITSVMEEVWTPPVPCSGVNVEYCRSAGPRPDALLHLLPALREVVFSGTLDVCRAFFSDAKVDAVGEAAPANTTSLRGRRAGGDVDPVETPDLVTEDDPRGQASHPSDGLLPGAGGNLPRRDSARNGRESRGGLGGSAGAPAPAGGAAGGVGRRSMGDLARLVGSTASCHAAQSGGSSASCNAAQAPSDSTQAPTAPEGEVEPSPVLQPPMPVPAEAPPLPAPAEAPPLGVPLPIQPPLPPPSTAAPTYSWTPTPAPKVGAVYSSPSGQSYRVREELGLLSEAEKEAGFGNLLPPPQVPKEPPRDP